MTKASNTRHNILEKAFELIYKKSYQTTSIDEIIANTKVTKGAFYYHFKTKEEMGIAIINEIIKPRMLKGFIIPLQNSKKPIDDIYLVFKALLLESPYLTREYGCSLGNLIQEMTPWNTEFGKALNESMLIWQTTLENNIKKGILNGDVRSNVNPKQTAYFMISSYWGVRNLGKVFEDDDCYYAYLKELKTYLSNLK